MKHFDLKPFFQLILIVYFPFLILVIIGFVYIPSLKDYIKEVIGFGMLSFLLLIIYLILKKIKIRKYYLLFIYFFLSFLLIIKLSFYYNFKAKLSSSVLYLMFETNTSEATEFLSNYIDFKLIILYILISTPFILLINYLFNSKTKKTLSKILSFKLKNKFSTTIILFLIFLTSFLIKLKLSDENILIKSISSYNEYTSFKKKFKEVLSLNTNKNIKVISSKNEPQTYVVIIGESTSNWHMQLYDYHRNTNPLLTEIKDELIIYKNVITTNVHTILALEKILTLINFENQKLKIDNASIIQLANNAGFSTYWVSNQRPIGFHESVPSLIGNAADYKYFLNTQNYDAIAYDEILLPTLDEILNDTNKKRIIFLHLMGTHVKYYNRYPKKFNVFKDNNVKTDYKNSKSINLINQYDNAIRYNDFVVRNIIDKVKSKNLNSYVLYFSDHGDELFDTFNFSGHNSHYSTKPMHEVPFILWMSNKYKSKHPQITRSDLLTERKYILGDFIHSFSDLSDINFKGFNSKKSVFSLNFKEKKRFIKDGMDYDK